MWSDRPIKQTGKLSGANLTGKVQWTRTQLKWQ